MIITSSIFWSFKTGLNLAPIPFPEGSIICKSGTEKYSFPPNPILILSIWPLLIIGFNDAFLPFCNLIIGFRWLLMIVDPYPVPFSYRYNCCMLPLTFGVILISAVAVVPTPTASNSTNTFISGYLNVWSPVPVDSKLVTLRLLKFEVIDPPTPALLKLNESSLFFST